MKLFGLLLLQWVISFACGAILAACFLGCTSRKSLDRGPDGRLFPASDDYNKGFKDGFHQGIAEGVLLTQ